MPLLTEEHWYVNNESRFHIHFKPTLNNAGVLKGKKNINKTIPASCFMFNADRKRIGEWGRRSATIFGEKNDSLSA